MSDALLSRTESNIVRINKDRRIAHYGIVSPTGWIPDPSVNLAFSQPPDGNLVFSDFAISIQASAWLAWYHLTKEGRKEALLPDVRERLENCDIDFTIEFLETRSAVGPAAEALSVVMHASQNTHYGIKRQPVSDLHPFAIMLAEQDSVLETVATLASAFDVPQISPTSTSSKYDNKDIHPLFARTITSDSGEARAVVAFLKDWGVTHFALIYTTDSYGVSYHASLLREARRAGLSVWSSSYEDESIESMKNSLEQLAKTRLHYVVGALSTNTNGQFAQTAYELGLWGNSKMAWILSGNCAPYFLSPAYSINRKLQSGFAEALDGVGIVVMKSKDQPSFDAALDHFSRNSTMLESFLSKHGYSQQLREEYSWPSPASSIYHLLAYDAVIASGIAACECEQDLFTGPEFYRQLLNTNFDGLTGRVDFNNATGTRDNGDFQFIMVNIRSAKDRSTADMAMFDRVPTSTFDHSSGTLLHLQPFLFASSSKTQPLALPPLVQNHNFKSSGLIAGGLLLGSTVMITSIGLAVWTIKNRDKPAVKASQPIFLFLLCAGTFLIAASIIPSAFQEPMSDELLDLSCMVQPWLLYTGSALVIATIFSKTWRLNKIFNDSRGFRRVTVQARHAMLPFVVIFPIIFILLCTWTVVAPKVWIRIESQSNVDEYGRSQETFGKCTTELQSERLFFGVPLAVVNVTALLGALLELHKARNICNSFSESKSLFFASASILEAVAIGGPLLFLSRDNPSSYFMVRTVLVFMCTSAVLLSMFVPKILMLGDEKHSISLLRGSTMVFAPELKDTKNLAVESPPKNLQPGLIRLKRMGSNSFSSISRSNNKFGSPSFRLGAIR